MTTRTARARLAAIEAFDRSPEGVALRMAQFYRRLEAKRYHREARLRRLARGEKK